MPLPAGPHRRYNPLLDEWVLCSPNRLDRPWQGQVEPVPDERQPPYDPDCYLCPGNVRANGARNPAYTATFVFDNDFPTLTPADASQGMTRGLLRARVASGVTRVLCFTPRHDLSIARMAVADIRRVVDAWADEMASLGARADLGYVQLFENKGAQMGCSNPHPHCQIWATAHVPSTPAKLLATQRKYFDRCGTDLIGDYLAEERSDGARTVCGNDHWTALVPFWAAWPFETIVVPHRRVGDLGALEPEERDALAEILKRLNVRYDNVFHSPFPYSMAWRVRPSDGAEHPEWRLHAVYFPPLLRSAAIRKFVVGYELAAEPQRDLTPEDAARRLREASERHYLDDVG